MILGLFLYLPVVWAALLLAQSLGGGLPELLENLTAALEHPFEIRWTDRSLLSILICTGVYLMGFCLYAEIKAGHGKGGSTVPLPGGRPDSSTFGSVRSGTRSLPVMSGWGWTPISTGAP